jgi:AcrR family transcriptional regulator
MSTRLQTALTHRILDAAGRTVARHGIRKTTIEDIAREASCSRAGLYKHFSGKDAVLQALFLREVDAYLAALVERFQGASNARLLENAFVFAVRYVRDHPVARGVIELEPEVFVAAFTESGGDVGMTAVNATATLIEVLIGRGDIRKVNSRVAAEALLRLLVSFVLVPSLGPSADEESSIRRLFREVVMRGISNR